MLFMLIRRLLPPPARPPAGPLLLPLFLVLGACEGLAAGGTDEPLLGTAEFPLAGLDAGGSWQPTPSTGPLQLSSLGYTRGAADAELTVYEFSDFGCSFCGTFAQGTYPRLHREYVDAGRVRWTFIPLVMGFAGGEEAARAAECAGEQGGFWAMHDALFARQKEWQAQRPREDLFVSYAEGVGLDAERFASCYRENRGEHRIRRNNSVALLLGLRASPSFRVNGRLVEGALEAEPFRQLLDASLPAR